MPRTTESYVIYLLVVLVLALIYVYTNMGREPLFLWTGVGLFIALLVLQFRELSRGEAYARAKIKVTHSDLEKMRKKGWM